MNAIDAQREALVAGGEAIAAGRLPWWQTMKLRVLATSSPACIPVGYVIDMGEGDDLPTFTGFHLGWLWGFHSIGVRTTYTAPSGVTLTVERVA